jgi:hypothetical protein
MCVIKTDVENQLEMSFRERGEINEEDQKNTNTQKHRNTTKTKTFRV